MNLVSRGSTSRRWFPSYSLVWLPNSHLCYIALQTYQPAGRKNLHDVDEEQSTFDTLRPNDPLEERGELIVTMQVAMVTERGSRRTMPNSGVGSLIGDLPLGSQGEDAKGSRQGYLLPRTPQTVSEAKERGKNDAQLSSLTVARSTA